MTAPPPVLAAAIGMVAEAPDDAAALRGALVALAEAAMIAERLGDRGAADGFNRLSRLLRQRLAPPAAAPFQMPAVL